MLNDGRVTLPNQGLSTKRPYGALHMDRVALTRNIIDQALRLGFSACGVARVEPMEREASILHRWLADGHHGEMAYMARHADLRVDPTKLLPGAKTVISCLLNYYPHLEIFQNQKYRISRYAYGKDYHDVMREKLSLLVQSLGQLIPGIATRVCVDTAPILERSWAVRAGLGWIGRNSLLLTPKGSYFFLGEIIIDAELAYDSPKADHCGRCRACVDACPNGAILEGRIIDARRCISYLTIELKGPIPDIYTGKTRDWIYGCDICQEVCPFNRKAALTEATEFAPSPKLESMTDDHWEKLTPLEFKSLFAQSAVKRLGPDRLRRNIESVRMRTSDGDSP